MEKNDSCALEKKIRFKINIFDFLLKPHLANLDAFLTGIINDLGLSKELVNIKPTYKDYLKFCPILAKASLSKYKSIIPILHNFKPLSHVDYILDIYNATFAGVIVEKSMRPPNDNKRKMRAIITVAVGEHKQSLFISGGAYDQNQETIDNLKV